ncbi:M24 family metallopeptidase [Fervidobacterium thailandense]|uniref:Xaa-Pro dipeptidase n=1 Tax=Fervidobacterium thailandense TaxID=1008305 RepID=A0A1E3G4H2_9BACT|nr:Xaa-Pro peptidase family protein [Fervidobacterium thailandense]ODN31175.1 Xaa-Pro dipeptidase [Fervidobacterium thailandense]
MNNHLQEVKDRVFQSGIDAILVLNIESSNTVTTRYLSGFTGSFSALIITPKRHIILTDSRYWTQVKSESDFELVKYLPPKTFLDSIAEILSSLEVKKLGLEKDKISLAHYETLVSKVNCEIEDISAIISDVRSRKSEEEIEQIKVAVEIAEEAFRKMLEIVRPGMKESELAAYLEYQVKLLGAEDVAFESIIASGPRSALPHGRASKKVIEKGEPVVVDWGARYKGYNSDITRVFCIGEPNERVKLVHRIVYEAQQKALEGIKAGKTGREIDEIARNHINEAGYGEFFGHGLGHGLGLEVHESPSLSYRNDKPLEVGNVVTVEPGIYLEGEFGVRIEEDVVVTENGCTVLTTLERGLIIL